MEQRVMYYFDMDGVIADWESAYNAVAPMPLEDFSALSREEREVIKRDLFNYEFFAKMSPLESGMSVLRAFIDQGLDVTLLSATGHVNKSEVMRGKADFVEVYLGDSIELMFVDKVEQKHERMIEGYDIHVLFDDRQSAIDAWNENGGIGILFQPK